ncbi:ras GTPase-activating protein 4 [Anopheles sinensis]|uniref:Ras GTPase-activating protein 4 n=1 Tax=Anopheles sinensis TaxID=74873 RepID=A0A084VWE4_ANOSI|nr:ras GTPase-activating protein 4 [Anopheles sinensis]
MGGRGRVLDPTTPRAVLYSPPFPCPQHRRESLISVTILALGAPIRLTKVGGSGLRATPSETIAFFLLLPSLRHPRRRTPPPPPGSPLPEIWLQSSFRIPEGSRHRYRFAEGCLKRLRAPHGGKSSSNSRSSMSNWMVVFFSFLLSVPPSTLPHPEQDPTPELTTEK